MLCDLSMIWSEYIQSHIKQVQFAKIVNLKTKLNTCFFLSLDAFLHFTILFMNNSMPWSGLLSRAVYEQLSLPSIYKFCFNILPFLQPAILDLSLPVSWIDHFLALNAQKALSLFSLFIYLIFYNFVHASDNHMPLPRSGLLSCAV